MSDWAPLCIGPYCQANLLASASLIFAAGQIALRPDTMSLVAGSVSAELPLCFRNAANVLAALRSSV
ncbi:unnamed protein product, partial [Phaeothamnion confervicola]